MWCWINTAGMLQLVLFIIQGLFHTLSRCLSSSSILVVSPQYTLRGTSSAVFCAAPGVRHLLSWSRARGFPCPISWVVTQIHIQRCYTHTHIKSEFTLSALCVRRNVISVVLTSSLFIIFIHSDPLRYHPPVSPSVPAPVPTAGPQYYTGQTVYPPSPPIIVPTPQQPLPAKREKKTVSILVVPFRLFFFTPLSLAAVVVILIGLYWTIISIGWN